MDAQYCSAVAIDIFIHTSSIMSRNRYVTMEPFEKEQIERAKEKDERFSSPSRITTGAYLALLAQERLEEWDGDE